MTLGLRQLRLPTLLAICFAAAGALAQRSPQPLAVNVEGRPAVLYDASYALLIGASQYEHEFWDDLQHVPKELDAVAEELTRHGFAVERVDDPKGEALLARIRKFIADRRGPNNRLIVYFSGHGWTDGSREVGYLVPVDAPNPAANRPDFDVKALSMRQVLAVADEVRANHALFLFDSCFSGALFLAKSNAVPLNRLAWEDLRLPVRQFVTAGNETQRVPGESQFTPAFINAIAGLADMNGDGYVSGTELAFWVRDTVIKGGKSTPQSGMILGLRRPGEILFAPDRNTRGAPPSTPSATPAPAPPTAAAPLPWSASAVPPDEREAKIPEISDPLFRNLDIRYFRKAADGNRITEAMDKSRVPYSVQRSFLSESMPTNTIACHPEVPGQALRELALTLINAGVEVRQIRHFVKAEDKRRRIEIVATGYDNNTPITSAPLRREQVYNLTECPALLRN